MALAALLLIPPALLPVGPAPSRRVALQGAASLAGSLLLQPLGAPLAAHAAEANSRRPTIALAGGGVFFWWQAGALGWLDKRFKLSDAQFLGGSTGALTATLAASGCNMDQVYRTADKLSSDVGYWDNGVWGLRGVWGDYIRNWLDACLPADASDRCNGRLLVALTELAPKFGTHYISEFRDRDDILAVNLASVHVPYYINGQFTDDFHGHRVIDGSIYLPTLSEPETLARPPYHLPDGSPPELLICHADDPRMRERYPSPVDFLKAGLPPAALEEMIGWGAAYMETLDAAGALQPLEDAGVARRRIAV